MTRRLIHWLALVAALLSACTPGVANVPPTAWPTLPPFSCPLPAGPVALPDSEPAPVSDPRLAVAHEHVDPRLVAANTRFAFKLYHAVAANTPVTENLMISPASVALALAMTYNGAAGDTQVAMAQTLELQTFERDELNQA